MSDDYVNDPIKRLAKRLRTHTRDTMASQGRWHRYAVVKAVNPLTADLVGAQITLEEGDDMTVSQWVRRYDKDHTIKVGDTIVVVAMGDGDFLATDVVSDTDL